MLVAHIQGILWSRQVAFFQSPMSILLAFSLAKAWPYSLLSFYYPEVIDYRVADYIGLDNVASVIVQFNVYYSLFISALVFAYWGIGGFSKEPKVVKAFQTAMPLVFRRRKAQFWFLTVIALLMFPVKWTYLGGVAGTVIGGEVDRYTASAGLGYVFALADLSLTFASLVALVNCKLSGRRRDYLVAIIVFACLAVSFSLLGGRKPLLQHVVICLALWSLLGGGVRIFSWKTFLIVLASAGYFVLLLEWRLSAAEKELIQSNSDFLLFSGVVSFLSNFSYNQTYYFLVEFFSKNSLWLGQTYIDLLYSPFPSSFYPEKPPVDDGTYVKALVEGWGATVGYAASEFKAIGSWPPETFGITLINFGWYSLPLAALALAIFYSSLIRAVLLLGANVPFVYILFQSALNFQLSNLRIVNLLTLIVFGLFLWQLARVLAWLVPHKRATRTAQI